MVIVDTSVWVDYLSGTVTPHVDWLDRELTQQRIGVLDLVLCEVLQGVQSEPDAERVLRALRRFEIFSTGGPTLATESARNYRLLRSQGRSVRKTIDCVIATFCLLHGHALLHVDRDFDPFEKFLGLRVLHPESGGRA